MKIKSGVLNYAKAIVFSVYCLIVLVSFFVIWEVVFGTYAREVLWQLDGNNPGREINEALMMAATALQKTSKLVAIAMGIYFIKTLFSFAKSIIEE